MVYYLRIFGKIVFVGALDDDAIRIQVTGSIGKYGRTVFKIVSPADNFERTKNGITLMGLLVLDLFQDAKYLQ